MLYSKFKKLINFIKNKNLLILTHDLADIDGFVSTLTLKLFLNQVLKNQKIYITFSELSSNSKDFKKNFSKKFPDFGYFCDENIDFSSVEVILIIDTNNLDLVKSPTNFDIQKSDIPIIFIDHHLNLDKKYKNNDIALNLIYEDFSSTAELIFELFEYFKVDIPNTYRFLLAAGILTDSGFFKYANNNTISRISKILTDKATLQDKITLLERRTNVSEKIAKIKGLQRVRLIRIGERLVGISNVSSFSASVATMLINIGFDVSIVYSQEKDDFRITTRAKKEVCQKTGLHLGKILSEISKGKGGGHDGAASVSGKENLDIYLGEIINKLKQTLII